MGRGDHRLSHTRDALGEHLPAARGRARRARRRAGGAAASGSSSASASSSESTASRCSPCEPNWRRSRSPLATRTSSRCGPEPGRAAVDVLREPRLERLDASAAPRRSRGARPAGRARPRARRTPAASVSSVDAAELDERRAERGDALRPRLERRAVRQARLHPAKRGVPLRERREVLLRRTGTSREDAAEHAVEVRAARGRPALHDGEPVGREDERRELAAKRLGRRQPRAVQPRLLRLPLAQRHRCLDRRRAAAPATPTRAPPSRRSGSAAPSWRVRGEKPCVARCSDSSRFVLPTPLRPTTSTTPGARSRSSDVYDRYWRSVTRSTISRRDGSA